MWSIEDLLGSACKSSVKRIIGMRPAEESGTLENRFGFILLWMPGHHRVSRLCSLLSARQSSPMVGPT